MTQQYKSPKATVAAIVSRYVNDQEEILLTQRSDTMKEYPGKWCLPGGHIDENEKARDAVIREVREETGLEYNATFLFPYDEIIPEYSIHAVVSIFQGTAKGELRIDEDEVQDAKWVALNDLSGFEFAFEHENVIGLYAKSKKPSLTLNLNQVTIPSIDLKKSATFYKKLGLQLIVDSIPRYARFVCPDGGSTLSLHRVDQLPKGEGISVYFECSELDRKVALLKKQGLEFVHDPIDQQWFWREAGLQDPDGNKIILYFAGENRLNPPWRVN